MSEIEEQEEEEKWNMIKFDNVDWVNSSFMIQNVKATKENEKRKERNKI